MAKIEVLRVRATMTQSDMEPPWVAEVSYGSSVVDIPLPAHDLITDDDAQSRHEWIGAMESLARALLDFADHIRKRSPSDYGL